MLNIFTPKFRPEVHALNSRAFIFNLLKDTTMKLKLLFSALLLGAVLVACNKDDSEEEDQCDTSSVTYTSDIATIFNASCAVSSCHVDGNEDNAKFSLSDYEKAKTAAGFGRIVGAISHEEGFTAMPYGSDKLEQCSIDKISAWINAGTPE